MPPFTSVAECVGVPLPSAQAATQSVMVYAYDNNGSVLSRSNGALTDRYSYDAEGRLITADVQIAPFSSRGAVTYTYDADGMRTSKTVGGVTTFFLVDKNRDVPQVLLEATGNDTVVYSYGNDLISQTRPGIGTRFYQVPTANTRRGSSQTLPGTSPINMTTTRSAIYSLPQA